MPSSPLSVIPGGALSKLVDLNLSALFKVGEDGADVALLVVWSLLLGVNPLTLSVTQRLAWLSLDWSCSCIGSILPFCPVMG